MEASAPLPVRTVPVDDLRPLAEADGPFASVYVDTDPAVEQAAHRSVVNWRPLREQLARDGAPDGVLASIDPIVPDAHKAGATLAVIAGPAGLYHVEHFPQAPRRPLARWGPAPALLPLISHRQWAAPYVLVLADRTGADVTASAGGDAPADKEAAGGEPGPIHRPQPGGWSQPRYQRRAENTWEHNARDVAELVTRLADEVHAVVVAVGGDVRAVELLRRDLPPRVVHLVAEVDATRALDGSDAARPLHDVIAAAVARETAEVMRRLVERPALAASGAAATFGALQEARVAVLVVQAHEEDARDAWFGHAPAAVGLTEADARAASGGQPVQPGRLVDVAVRAALGTGAAVHVLPGNPPDDGVSALLRWTEPA